MKMEQTVFSETSAYKIQTPRNYLEVSTQHSEQGENLKSRIQEFYSSTVERADCLDMQSACGLQKVIYNLENWVADAVSEGEV